MRYIEAPAEYDGNGPAVFLAGGITDTADWQSQLTVLLGANEGTVLNPRRREFPMGDPSEGRVQIEWEFRHLKLADLVAFWFPPETLCPIALFELGACCGSNSPIVVGTDPEYSRRFDVECRQRHEEGVRTGADPNGVLARAILCDLLLESLYLGPHDEML